MDVGTVSGAAGQRHGRPAVALIAWFVLLVVLAAVAPAVQAASGLSFDVFAFVVLAPALACVVGVIRPDWMPAGWRHVHMRSVLISATLGCGAVAVFVAILALLVGRSPTWPLSTAGVSISIFLLLQVLGALAEEFGWRGYVQRCGEQFARPVIVSVTAGFLFGATHLGYWSLGLIPVLTFAVVAALMSVTITTIFTGSLWQRMIPAVIVHLGVNLGIASLSGAHDALAAAPGALVAAAAMAGMAFIAKSVFRTA